MITGWIQSADFSNSDLGVLKLDSARRAFLQHDWESENSLFETLGSRGEEHCPPGLGLVAESGRILHICPANSKYAMYHYHYAVVRRIIGIPLGKAQRTQTCSEYPLANVPALIEAFYSDDHEQLLLGAS